MNWRLTSRLSVGMVAATLTLAWASADPCPSRCEDGKVRLGISAPITGPHVALGRQTIGGAEAAVRDLNKGGGVAGFPVELVVVDDKCDVGFVLNAARQLIAQKTVKYLIGPTCPPAAMVAAPLYAEADVMQFMPTMTEVGITWRNPGNFFRIAETDDQTAQALAAHLSREYQGKSVVIVYTDSYYMRPLIETVRARLPASMNMSVRFETLMDVSGAAELLVEKLRRSPPDLIYVALDPEPIAHVVGLLRKSGIGATIMGGQRLLTYRFLRRAEAEGVEVLAPLGPLNNPEYLKAVNLLEQSDVIPDLIALNSYAAVQTWAEAVRQAGSGEHGRVVEVLQSSEINTAVGLVAFDLRGDRRSAPNTMVTLQNGQLRASVTPR